MSEAILALVLCSNYSTAKRDIPLGEKLELQVIFTLDNPTITIYPIPTPFCGLHKASTLLKHQCHGTCFILADKVGIILLGHSQAAKHHK